MDNKQVKISVTRAKLLKLHHLFSTSASYLGEQLTSKWSTYQSLHAFGVKKMFSFSKSSIQTLHQITQNNGWLFGIIAYDLKNDIEELTSANVDELQFPELLFFEPNYVVVQENDEYSLYCNSNQVADFIKLLDEIESKEISYSHQNIDLIPRISKEEYFKRFSAIQEQIHLGNVYELNFCQEFFQENQDVQMHSLFWTIYNRLEAPFMSFFQHEHIQAISASPERFLQRKGLKLISQPIKGTAKRGQNQREDIQLKQNLNHSLKERTENIMIVDLVRNDLGKCCKPGSIQVEEFVQLYTFPNIHQLISTISGELKVGIEFSEIMRHMFPMGSMTGAPKRKMMQLAERFETTKRGWYSGAMGYIEPNGNFDFNVMIRSLLYNATQQYLSYTVGGGLTSFSNANEEYEECLNKLHSVVNLINRKPSLG